MSPLATYRLQLNSELGFTAAAALAPYLRRLGVTHVYTSPILKARPGSTHGYDIVAHDALNPELGAAAQFDAMVAAFSGAGLEILLDFVPNHMGVGGADNPLWLDVLEWGSESAYAGWFDIDWEPHRGYLHDKLLVPVLGDQYGIELDAGKLVLKLDEAAGDLAVWAYDHHKLPICPLTYGDVLGSVHPTLERLGDEFGALKQWKPQVVRRAAELKRELAAAARSDGVRDALAGALERVNRPDDDGVRRALDALIQKQNWRAAHFRVAGDDINYRRFFNINDLAGLRIELPEVFEHVHRLVLELVGHHVVAGLRIDHIDGLLEPRAYLERLRAALARVGVPDCYVVVEKILARGETLPDSWPVAGTTGYEFGAAALQLLLDPAGEVPLTRLYRELTDERTPFVDVVHEAKLKIMRNEMASEVNVLARDAARVARQNPRTADFTHGLLRAALRELIASFPVYRTYVDGAGRCAEKDLQELGEAVAAAARRRAVELDSSVFAFLARMLSGKLVEAPHSGFSRAAVLRCAMKFQQLSGPVMAKGLEDTAFYRYNRFIALNEVGGAPQRIGSGTEEFHALNAERARRWPYALSATATHDTKRGEDTRARLAVLTELAGEWAEQVREWRRLLRGAEPAEGAPPDANDEYYFYQSLLGAWPPELCDAAELDGGALAAFAGRLRGALCKAVREAKRHSTWTAPDERYEAALLGLVDTALGNSTGDEFLARFVPFASSVARLGVHNSLVQLALKLTAPGVPDLYQGCELWDFSLVDPDNRRRVDFAERAALLEAVEEGMARDPARAFAQWRREWHDGRVKLAATRTLLELRAREAALFREGNYVACEVTGPRADEILAFARRRDGRIALTAVQRFPVRADRNGDWRGTHIRLPRDAEGGVDVFTGRSARGPALDPKELFATLPIAVLAPP